MSISTEYVLHGVQSGTPSAFISQISNLRVTPSVQTFTPFSAGLPFPLFTGNTSTNPGITFDTTQLKTILDLSGALESMVDLSGGNCDLWFKKVADRGRRVADATAEHFRFRMSQAWLSLQQIQAGHNREATASVRIGTTWDGTNDPIIPAGSTALSGTPTHAEHWTVGQVKINTVNLPGVEDVTIDFGRQVMEHGSEGDIYNTFAAVQSYAPVITVRGFTHSWATYGLNGTVLTALDLTLRQVTAVGRTAAATQTHLQFTATAGLITVDESGGGANDPSMTTLRIQLVGASATAEPIACDTTAAIA